ncbi:flavoprotein [Tessaracoccus palaemonis]|uniref:Flavoprotein domain protein n=1 Tax=Tessaracoccus palaemonis TaxID=2829499 RepID=A0ABX8SIR4_9ACTN|nr:flavoprotein [Tessaracoccus palaemonis]QXT63271.1 flavoprotein domain protein [Tessaracoccus palaemonis]
MTEQELRSLIRQVVVEVLADGAPARPEPRNALVLFTGALLGFEASLESLRRLKATGLVNLDWTQTHSASKILDQQAIESIGMCPAEKSLVMGHDMLIIPTATVNMVAKVAHGIGDCLASNVMAEFIMFDKPVVLSVNACGDTPDKRGWFPDLPAGYSRMLQGNLEALASFGVTLASSETLDEAVGSLSLSKGPEPAEGKAVSTGSTRFDKLNDPVVCAERLIHDGIVKTVAPRTTLRVGAGALITALARETAAARNIIIEREH